MIARRFFCVDAPVAEVAWRDLLLLARVGLGLALAWLVVRLPTREDGL